MARQRRFEEEWCHLFASWVKDRAEDILDHTAAIIFFFAHLPVRVGWSLVASGEGLCFSLLGSSH
jgi:hypothetical protein